MKVGRGRPRYLGEVAQFVARALRCGVKNAAREAYSRLGGAVRTAVLVEVLEALVALARLGVEYIREVRADPAKRDVVVDVLSTSRGLLYEELERAASRGVDVARVAEKWVGLASSVLRHLEELLERLRLRDPEAYERAVRRARRLLEEA